MVSYLNNKNSSYNYKLFNLNLDNNNNHTNIKVDLYKKDKNKTIESPKNNNSIPLIKLQNFKKSAHTIPYIILLLNHATCPLIIGSNPLDSSFAFKFE